MFNNIESRVDELSNDNINQTLPLKTQVNPNFQYNYTIHKPTQLKNIEIGKEQPVSQQYRQVGYKFKQKNKGMYNSSMNFTDSDNSLIRLNNLARPVNETVQSKIGDKQQNFNNNNLNKTCTKFINNDFKDSKQFHLMNPNNQQSFNKFPAFLISNNKQQSTSTISSLNQQSKSNTNETMIQKKQRELMQIKKQLDQLSKKFVYNSDKNNPTNINTNTINPDSIKTQNVKVLKVRQPKSAGVSQSVIIQSNNKPSYKSGFIGLGGHQFNKPFGQKQHKYNNQEFANNTNNTNNTTNTTNTNNTNNNYLSSTFNQQLPFRNLTNAEKIGENYNKINSSTNKYSTNVSEPTNFQEKVEDINKKNILSSEKYQYKPQPQQTHLSDQIYQHKRLPQQNYQHKPIPQKTYQYKPLSEKGYEYKTSSQQSYEYKPSHEQKYQYKPQKSYESKPLSQQNYQYKPTFQYKPQSFVRTSEPLPNYTTYGNQYSKQKPSNSQPQSSPSTEHGSHDKFYSTFTNYTSPATQQPTYPTQKSEQSSGQVVFKKKRQAAMYEPIQNQPYISPNVGIKKKDIMSHTVSQFPIPEIKKFKIKDFAIGKKMGKGQFGEVMLAKHKQTGFICGLKVMQKQKIRQEDYAGQIARQLSIQFYLNHRNIAPLYGYFQDQKTVYLLVEFCTGGQLLQKLRGERRMNERDVSTIIKQVCEGVDYIHKQLIIHRDIKPENILFNFGIVKISDFGWAVYRGFGMRKTASGSPLYYPPEIVKGESYDDKIDVWNIGMMTYECILGKTPFRVYSQLDLGRIVSDDISFPSYVDVSDDAKDFILKTMKKIGQERMEIRQMLRHPFITKHQDLNISETILEEFKRVLN